MARFLMIHGAGHGAWCWRDVLPLLADAGHDAAAIDLPGRAGDPRPKGEITLADYADAILAALDGPTILVGHSLAGMSITAAAEKDPGNIARLVFLCAWMPLSGHSARDMRDWAPRNLLAGLTRMTDDGTASYFDPASAAGALYQDCPADAVAYAMDRLFPEPIEPQRTKVHHGKTFENLPKSYLICRDDRVIDPDAQRLMAARLPEADRYELPCGHSPFFAAPGRLAAILNQIAEPT